MRTKKVTYRTFLYLSRTFLGRCNLFSLKRICAGALPV